MSRRAPRARIERWIAAVILGGLTMPCGAAGSAAKPTREAPRQTAHLPALPSRVAAQPTPSSANSSEAIQVTAFTREVEPNDTSATATPIASTPRRLRGDSYAVPVPPTGDVDTFSFSASAGDRVYVATITDLSAGSGDSMVDILASDGTTVLESDDEDGALTANAATVAGTLLPVSGTYFVRVRPFTTTLPGTIRPYDLYLHVHSGAPAAEVEPNDNGAPGPQPLPPGGWVAGSISSLGDTDSYSVAALPGETIVAIFDADPERDTPEWNPRLGVGVFNGFFLLVDGSGVGGPFDDAAPSEALVMTVHFPGVYQVLVDESPVSPPPSGAATNTYHLSVSVLPRDNERTLNHFCNGTNGAIPDGGVIDFTCNITISSIVDYLQLTLNETHAGATPATQDLDVSLISPDGNEVVLFDDPASASGAAAPQFNTVIEDEAAVGMSAFGVYNGVRYAPEGQVGRFDSFRGMQALGTWRLRVRDDGVGDAGNLNSWRLTIGNAQINTGCASPVTEISASFDSDAGGFTHSGTADEWERGVPGGASTPIVSCHAGSCFKTDLAGGYEANASYDLVSPPIDLTSSAAPVTLTWWQKFQFDSASSDSFWVEVRVVGNPASARKVWEWKGAAQTRTVGLPATVAQESAGWGRVQAAIGSFVGQVVEVRFHAESDAATQGSGWAVDDVLVQSECTLPVELSDFGVE